MLAAPDGAAATVEASPVDAAAVDVSSLPPQPEGFTVIDAGGEALEANGDVALEGGERRVRKQWMVVEPNSSEEILVNDDDVEIDLIACKLSELEDLAPFTKVETLLLRQNLLDETELQAKLASVSPTLTHLDLYENRIESLPFTQSLASLTYLDLSCNAIRETGGGVLSPLVNCTELYLTANKLKLIEGLEACTSLAILELGCNRLRSIENLAPLPKLKELWLAKNKIVAIENMDHLTQLTKLSLQSNRLTETINLSPLTLLVELYLSENGLATTAGCEALVNLKVLDFASNRITTVTPLAHLTQLEDLWLDNNQLEASFVTDCVTLLPASPVFDTIRIDRNPLCTNVPSQTYRRVLLEQWPTLDQIDSYPVKPNERSHALSLKTMPGGGGAPAELGAGSAAAAASGAAPEAPAQTPALPVAEDENEVD